MARARNEKTGARSGAITAEELRRAERSLRQMLPRSFPAAWVAANVRDIVAQASVDYSSWLRDNPPARDPVAWLVAAGRKRALDRRESESLRPGSVPLEAVQMRLVDDEAKTPEAIALDRDRRRRLAEAMAHLPGDDRRLLALVYYEGRTIREAGRILGWGKSRADRHHGAAMQLMLALVGERSLLSPALLGLVAQASILGDRHRLSRLVFNRISAAAQDLLDLIGSWLGSLVARGRAGVAERVVPLGEAGAALGAGGAGRILAQCATLATVAICGVIVVEHATPALFGDRPERPARQRPAPEPSDVAEEAAPTATEPPPLLRAAEQGLARGEAQRRREREARRARQRRREKIARRKRARRAERAERAAQAQAEQEGQEAAEAEAAEGSEGISPSAGAGPVEERPPAATGGQVNGAFGP